MIGNHDKSVYLRLVGLISMTLTLYVRNETTKFNFDHVQTSWAAQQGVTNIVVGYPFCVCTSVYVDWRMRHAHFLPFYRP